MPITTELKANQIHLIWEGIWITGDSYQYLTIHGKYFTCKGTFEIIIYLLILSIGEFMPMLIS